MSVAAVFSAALIMLVHSAGGQRLNLSHQAGTPLQGIHKIQHVVVIMQENRSFDSYFGTYPGANGIPMKNGVPTVCVPDPRTNGCRRPYHDPAVRNNGGPHGAKDARLDIDGGRMDGFVSRAEAGRRLACKNNPNAPLCSRDPKDPDVMGYHDWRETPNYWRYARNYVLQDRMFESDASWSLPAHLFIVSGWSAKCSSKGDPMSCVPAIENPGAPPGEPQNPKGASPHYDWTSLPYLLKKYNVSWRYYVATGAQPDCADDQMVCKAVPQTPTTPGIWNPLPWFTDVRANHQTGNVTSLTNFLKDAKQGTLPSVSWVTPSQNVSDHPPALVSRGQAYVTALINAVMRGPNWSSTAIFVAWDDWGGFYDHVAPPRVDEQGYGVRVPGFLIGPYVRKGYIDHQTLSFDAYLKFIEDDFLGGQRLNPKTDGRPDSRPAVRENAKVLGNLVKEFDFNQPPRKPMFLPLHPRRLTPAQAAKLGWPTGR